MKIYYKLGLTIFRGIVLLLGIAGLCLFNIFIFIPDCFFGSDKSIQYNVFRFIFINIVLLPIIFGYPIIFSIIYGARIITISETEISFKLLFSKTKSIKITDNIIVKKDYYFVYGDAGSSYFRECIYFDFYHPKTSELKKTAIPYRKIFIKNKQLGQQRARTIWMFLNNYKNSNSGLVSDDLLKDLKIKIDEYNKSGFVVFEEKVLPSGHKSKE